MAMRWKILSLLFAIRVTMALQYQAAAALSPFLTEYYGIQLADIGLLIGLYLSPGIAIALPGGALGKRFGDKRTVMAGLILMLIGALIIALMPGWTAQIIGRIIAGVGGVILNVLMTKMVTDWFRDGGLATAMGIFVNSWPVGIALALLILPPMAATLGLATTYSLMVVVILAGLLALLTSYEDPPPVNIPANAAPAAASSTIGRAAMTGLMMAALIWALYNSALSMIFSFGSVLLIEQGWSIATASLTASATLWLVALSVPAGGIIADLLKQRDLVLLIGLATFAALMFSTPTGINLVVLFIALGIVGGIAAGPIMSLPADVLNSSNRAYGMGLFFTVYYVAIFMAPIGAGYLSERVGNTEIAFQFGGVLLLACILCLATFRTIAKRHPHLSEG
eukprot:g17316.t1